MEEIATLLEKILAGSTFALTVNRLRDTTLDDRPEGQRLSTGIDTKSLGQCQAAELRELYEMGTWRSGEWGERLRIKPKCADGVAAHSASRIDSLLDGYLDSDKGHIGHALTDSIEGCAFGHHEANGFIGQEKVSALNDFRDYLIIGAAMLGTSRVAGHLRDWMAGKPLHYRTMALLVGAHIDENIELESGIRIEKTVHELEGIAAIGSWARICGAGNLSGRRCVVRGLSGGACSVQAGIEREGELEICHRSTALLGIGDRID